MLTGLSAKRHLKLAQSTAELLFTGTDEFCALLAVQHEVELRDGLHLESLARLSIVISLNGTEYDMLVLIGSCCTLICRLEAHARPTTW